MADELSNFVEASEDLSIVNKPICQQLEGDFEMQE